MVERFKITKSSLFKIAYNKLELSKVAYGEIIYNNQK